VPSEDHLTKTNKKWLELFFRDIVGLPQEGHISSFQFLNGVINDSDLRTC
jgi:hypothetical protein